MGKQVTRRELVRATTAGIGAGIFLSQGTFPVIANSGGWSQVGYDTGNTGYNPDAAGPTDEPETVWSYEPDTTSQIQPVVSNSRLYFSVGEDLTCLDPVDGTELWTATQPSTLSSPAVHDGTVYVSTTDGNTLALDGAGGQREWETTLLDSNASTPTVTADSLYVSDNLGLYELRRSDGEIQWGIALEEPQGSVPAVTDLGVWTLGSSLVQVSSVDQFSDSSRDPESAENWERRQVANIQESRENPPADETRAGLIFTAPNFESQGTPSVVDDTVYLPSQGVQAIDAHSGRVEWNFDENVIITQSPTVAEDTVYFGSGLGAELAYQIEGATENAGTVYALDRSTGSVNWERDLGDPIDTQIAATSNSLYVSTKGGTIVGLDRETGDERWQLELAGGVGSPIVAHNRLYVGTTDRGLLALEGPGDGTTPTPTPSPTPTPAETPTPIPERETSDPSGDTESSDDGFGAGFGLLSGLAGLCGMTYVLDRLRGRDAE